MLLLMRQMLLIKLGTPILLLLPACGGAELPGASSPSALLDKLVSGLGSYRQNALRPASTSRLQRAKARLI